MKLDPKLVAKFAGQAALLLASGITEQVISNSQNHLGVMRTNPERRQPGYERYPFGQSEYIDLMDDSLADTGVFVFLGTDASHNDCFHGRKRNRTLKV